MVPMRMGIIRIEGTRRSMGLQKRREWRALLGGTMQARGFWRGGLAAALLTAVSLPGCFYPAGGGLGTVKILLTDFPLDGKEVKAVSISLARVEIQSQAEGWQAVVDNGSTGVAYNLLDLVDDAAVVGLAALEAGPYTQIRLVLNEDNSILVEEGGEEEWHSLKIPSGTKTGIKLTGSFEVVAGGTTVIVLDFDAAKSIILTGSGKYKLKPTIRIKEVLPPPAAPD
jgi:hypothetical protein